MGTADELKAHRRRLGPHDAGEHPVEDLAAQIAMAVTAHRSEVVHPHPLGGESGQHALQPRPHAGGAQGGQGGDPRQSRRNAVGGLKRREGGQGDGHRGQGAAAMLPVGDWKSHG